MEKLLDVNGEDLEKSQRENLEKIVLFARDFHRRFVRFFIKVLRFASWEMF